MSVEYLDLVDYLAIAAQVTGLDNEAVMRVARFDLADSALHASAAGFGETEFYPGFVDKSAVLVTRLAKNQPLPDGNKGAAGTRVGLGRLWWSRSLRTQPMTVGNLSRPARPNQLSCLRYI